MEVQIGRRNLDASQRAVFVAKLPRLSIGNPGANSANLPNYAVDELAKMAGVSPRRMTSAVKVTENATPAIVEGVREGTFKVSDAAQVACLPKFIQDRLVTKAKERGTTLRKAAEPSGGTSFDPDELEIAIAVAGSKPQKNGASVVDGKEKAMALKLLSKLSRSLSELGLFDKHNAALSEMIRDVEALK